ncbi:MAG: branched-chain amino acid transaminase [Cyanobacteria bacterium HKST-UBA04]|nr:branched-chain amino acid transaminase [Cyanobacteria bacterium HKST-UBA04]
MQTTEWAYLRGEFVPLPEATISIKTHGFLYGTSVFEGIRGYWSDDKETTYLFRAREHFERMLRNAKLLMLDSPLDLEGMVATTTELIQRNNYRKDAYIQPRLYKSGQFIPPYIDGVETDYCCYTQAFGKYLDASKGIKVCVSSWRRLSDNSLTPRGKIGGAYVNSCLSSSEAHLNGFDDAIVLGEDGYIAEGSAMNLFMVKHNTLITPTTTDGILEGITRGTFIELAQQELGIEVCARRIQRSELYDCDELFFTGTAAQMVPIASVDHRTVGSGTGDVGPISQKLKDLYERIVKGNHPAYEHWLTPVPALAGAGTSS